MFRQEPNCLQVHKQGHAVKVRGIREKEGQAISWAERGEGWEEPAACGVIEGEVNQDMVNGKVNLETAANGGGPRGP